MNGDGYFELLSEEGTTQGCPLALVPLLNIFSHYVSKCGLQMMLQVAIVLV